MTMIDCTENEDGTFTITWNGSDPVESILNDWTEQDFIDTIMIKINQFKTGLTDNESN